jgi:hypothetical protein
VLATVRAAGCLVDASVELIADVLPFVFVTGLDKPNQLRPS